MRVAHIRPSPIWVMSTAEKVGLIFWRISFLMWLLHVKITHEYLHHQPGPGHMRMKPLQT